MEFFTSIPDNDQHLSALYGRHYGGAGGEDGGTHKPPYVRTFHRPHIPVIFQVVIILLVICPLFILRHFEKPRRRMGVWLLDLAKLALGYGSAELLLVILIIPYTSLLNRMIPPPPGFSSQHPFPPGSDWKDHKKWPTKEFGQEPNSKEDPNGNQPSSHSANKNYNALRFVQRFEFLQTTSLTLSTLEVFPGVFLIYGLYMLLLFLSYRAKLYWIKTLRRPRLVRDPARGWIIRTHATDGDDLYDPFLSDNERYSRASLGFVSGNYNHPIRVKWFVQQAACFTLSVFITRAIIVKICVSLPGPVNWLRMALFGWYESVSSIPARAFLLGVLIPSILYCVEFCVSDFMLRYRSKPNKGSLRSFALYNRSDLEMRRRQDCENENEFELHELTLPRLHEDFETRSVIVTAPHSTTSSGLNSPLDSPSAFSQTSAASSSYDLYTSPFTSSSLGPHSSSSTFPPPLGRSLGTSDDNDEILHNTGRSKVPSEEQHHQPSRSSPLQSPLTRPAPPSPPESVNVVGGLHYGIVTASLLNTAAVSATAISRPLMFGGPSFPVVQDADEERGDGHANTAHHSHKQSQLYDELRSTKPLSPSVDASGHVLRSRQGLDSGNGEGVKEEEVGRSHQRSDTCVERSGGLSDNNNNNDTGCDSNLQARVESNEESNIEYINGHDNRPEDNVGTTMTTAMTTITTEEEQQAKQQQQQQPGQVRSETRTETETGTETANNTITTSNTSITLSGEDVDRLPSYDDSQRQQRELLRNPTQAVRHHHVISEMKRV